MQVYFKSLHFVQHQQLVYDYFFLHTATLVTQLGIAQEFCFTVVFFELAANYLSRRAILQTLREPMEPPPLGSSFDVRWCRVVSAQLCTHTEDTPQAPLVG